MTSLSFAYLGVMPFAEAWDLQEKIRKEMLDGNPEAAQLLVMQHPPTISLGRAEKGTNLLLDSSTLKRQGFDVVETNRGGKITYHGPGQLIAYPIVDLRTFKMGVKQFVYALEETMIGFAEAFGIKAERREGCPGAWVDGKKIGSIGIHVRKQVSIHGLAFNVMPNLEHFQVIRPCGIDGVQMTSLANEKISITVGDAVPAFKTAFSTVFGCELSEVSALQYARAGADV